MYKNLEKIIIFFTDFLLLHLAFFIWAEIRWSLGFFSEAAFERLFPISMIMYGYWLVIFIFYGLYQYRHTHSRIDEFITVFKAVSIGIFLIFLLTVDVEKDLEHPLPLSRFMLISYWMILIGAIGSGRILIRSLHRKILEKGYGQFNTLIIGWGKQAWQVFDMLLTAPALGYKPVGFINQSEIVQKQKYKSVPVRGSLKDLSRVIKHQNVKEVIIALPRRSEKHVEEIVRQCDGYSVGIQIVPDHYDIMIGQVRTNQIYGVPLIEVLPELMPPWERMIKRLLDFTVAFTGLLIFLPFGLLIALLIIIDSRGPVFFSQERVGKNEKHFFVHKFRTMIQDAEKVSGPVWATEDDPRITRVGNVLRKLRLDEFPQLINVLRGEMSLVGPRPERPFFVEKLHQMFPLYKRRLRVRPGITGWAQVKGSYDTTLEAVKFKLDYDLYYLENMSIRMDVKIILNTLYVMIRGKGQ